MPYDRAKRIAFVLALACPGVRSAIAADPPPAAPAQTRTIEGMKARLIASWIDSANTNRAAGAVKTIEPDGTWKDVDYTDRSVGWKPAQHLFRMSSMAATARRATTPPEESARLLAAAGKALDAWLQRDPQGSNWWNNKIGTPWEVAKTLLLLQDLATPRQKQDATKIFDRATIGMTGENLVWLARNNIFRGLIENDEKRIADAYARIWAEVRDDLKEGVMPDASFHQHGSQFYVGGYGSGFLEDTTSLMAMAAGTPMAAPPEKIRILERYLLDGFQWMVYGGTMEPSARGRGIARGEGNPEPMVRTAAINLLASMPPAPPPATPNTARRQELQALIARLHAEPARRTGALSGNRYYWCSDFMVSHHTSSWYASIKMTSDRVLGAEFGNGENRNAYCQLFGQQYVMRRGDEYRDIYPVWDWTRVPGATMEALPEIPALEWTKGSRGTTSFVGGASDGTAGVAAFDLSRDGVKARKFWLFSDTAVIALGAGIQGTGRHPLRTSINQCWLKGNVIAHRKGDAGLITLRDNTAESGTLDYFLHDQVGYAILGPGAVTVANQTQKGRWSDINRLSSRDLIERPVFSAWIDHAGETTYAYAAIPLARPDTIKDHIASIRIIANTADVQCVTTGKLTAAVFYKPGTVGQGADALTVDKPCIVLVRTTDKGRQLAVSNPENKPLKLNVQLGTGSGSGPGQKSLPITLPDGPTAGSTVIVPAEPISPSPG